MGLLISAALGVFAFSGLSAGAAQADPFHVEFNAGTLRLGSQSDLAFLSTEEPATLDGTIDPVTGNITVPDTGVVIPPATFSTPLPGSISSEAVGDTTGNYDSATGQLDLDMVINSTTDLSTLGVTCHFDGFEWDLSTENTTPADEDHATALQGRRFDDAEGLEGDGAVDANWTDIPAARVGDPEACTTLVRPLAAGPGGVLLEHTVGPPPAAALSASVSPSKTTIRQGKTKKFTLTVANTGDADATGVEACVSAPKKAFAVKGDDCVDLGTLNPAAAKRGGPVSSKEAVFTLKAKRRARPKKYTVHFTASSPDVETDATDTAKVTVKKKRRRH